MLTKLHSNLLIVGVMAYLCVAYAMPGRALTLVSVASLGAYVTQLAMLLYFTRTATRPYSAPLLFGLTLGYTMLAGILFMELSWYYEGDTFMFSKSDAFFYYAESTKAASMGLADGARYLMQHYKYDDWGSLLLDMCLMWVVPSKYLLNLTYVLMGACSTVWLYDIGRKVMPQGYAFMAALAYGTSSYMIFYHCSFLKESAFVFLVIGAMHGLYRFMERNSVAPLLEAGLCVVLILFFRPAVAAMLVCGAFAYYGYVLKGRALSVFLYLMAALCVAGAAQTAGESIDQYTAGGNMDLIVSTTSNSNYSGSFNYFMSFIAALIGPFPSLYPQESGVTHLVFYGAGLTYKLFLALPFWFGAFWIIKERHTMLFPLLFFILLEMLATAYVCASMELRKVLLHVPFMYIIAFFGLHHYIESNDRLRLRPAVYYLFGIAVLGVWNLLRVK